MVFLCKKNKFDFLDEKTPRYIRLEMPCSQCGGSGHNIKTCFRVHNDFLGMISTDVLSTDHVPGLFRPVYRQPIRPRPRPRPRAPPVVQEVPLHPSRNQVVTLYHGTSLEAALSIQRTGFDTNQFAVSGRMLGNGIYLSPTIGKSLLYADGLCRPNPFGGVVLIVKVNIGACLELKASNSRFSNKWAQWGYDSCYLPGGIWGRLGTDRKYDEYCIKNSSRIEIIGAVLGNSVRAEHNGYTVEAGRVCKCN